MIKAESTKELIRLKSIYLIAESTVGIRIPIILLRQEP